MTNVHRLPLLCLLVPGVLLLDATSWSQKPAIVDQIANLRVKHMGEATLRTVELCRGLFGTVVCDWQLASGKATHIGLRHV